MELIPEVTYQFVFQMTDSTVTAGLSGTNSRDLLQRWERWFAGGLAAGVDPVRGVFINSWDKGATWVLFDHVQSLTIKAIG